jgi:cytochrome c
VLVLNNLNPVRIGLIGLGIAATAFISVTLINASQQRRAVAMTMTGGDPSRAPPFMRRFGCSGCHTISGIPGADGVVGGPLADMRRRVYVAGVLPNNADNLIRWLVNPTSVNPRTAMPATGISADEARDVAAYLYYR